MSLLLRFILGPYSKLTRARVDPHSYAPLPNKSRIITPPAASAGVQTISVGQVLENDLAQPITVILTQHPGVSPIQGIKPHSYAPLPNKTRLYTRYGILVSVGQAFEIDTAQAVTVVTTDHPAIKPTLQIKAHNPTQVPNNSRLYARYGILVSVGQAVENDSALAVTLITTDHPTVLLRGIQGHSYAPLPNRSRIIYRPEQIISVGQALENDLAQPVSAVLFTATPVLPLRGIQGHSYTPLSNKTRLYTRYGIVVAVGQAVENDLAQSVTLVTTEHPSVKATRGILAHSYAPLANNSRVLARKGIVVPVGDANEFKTLKIRGFTSGTFALSFQGGPDTAPLNWNANAAAVQSALEGLANIDPGDVICTDLGFEYDDQTLNVLVQFTGQWAATDITTLTIHNIDMAPSGSAQTFNTINGNRGPREADSALAITPSISDITVRPRRIVGHSYDSLPNKSRLYARVGQTITVGQAVENDLSQPVTIVITDYPTVKSIRGIQGFTSAPLPNKSRLYARQGILVQVGQAVENDIAQAVTVVYTDHPPVVSKSIGFTVTPLPNKSRIIVQLNQTIQVGQALEFDLSQSITSSAAIRWGGVIQGYKAHSYDPLPNKSRVLSRPGITVAVGQAIENDLAQPITVILTQHPAVTPTRAQGHSYPPLPNKSRLFPRQGVTVAVGQAVENDSAQAVQVVLTQHPSVQCLRGIQGHSYSPLPNRSRLFAKPGQTISIGQAVETDLAQPITSIFTDHPVRAVKGVLGFTADPLSNRSRIFRGKFQPDIIVPVGQAFEADGALSISPILGTGDRPRVIRPSRPHTPLQVPNRSRLFQILPPDFVRVGKTVTSAGMHSSRVAAGFTEEVVDADLKEKGRRATQGTEVIDARVRKNRTQAD